MLPDFILAKKHVAKILDIYLRKKIREDSFVGQFRHRIIHEGNHMTMKTFDGNVDEMDYKKIGSEFTIKTEDIIKEGIRAFIKHMDSMVEEMKKQQSVMVFQKLNEITKKTGNVVDSGGPLTKEKILESLEKIEMDFDENGQPSKMSLVVSPALFEKLKEEIPKWEKDIEYVAKYNAIIEKKRQAWRDRENNRKLVD